MTLERDRARTLVDVGCRKSELQEGTVSPVVANGIEIALIRWRDEVFAIRNLCPHQQAAICGGPALPTLRADVPGDVSIDEDQGILVCPWHRWEYDLRTGRGIRRPRHRVRTYGVEVVDDRVLVDLGPRRADPPAPGRPA